MATLESRTCLTTEDKKKKKKKKKKATGIGLPAMSDF